MRHCNKLLEAGSGTWPWYNSKDTETLTGARKSYHVSLSAKVSMIAEGTLLKRK